MESHQITIYQMLLKTKTQQTKIQTMLTARDALINISIVCWPSTSVLKMRAQRLRLAKGRTRSGRASSPLYLTLSIKMKQEKTNTLQPTRPYFPSRVSKQNATQRKNILCLGGSPSVLSCAAKVQCQRKVCAKAAQALELEPQQP